MALKAARLHPFYRGARPRWRRELLSYDAQRIFDKFSPESIGIIPLFFDHTVYCKKCQGIVSTKTCGHTPDDYVALSGTQVRQFLEQSQPLPVEFHPPGGIGGARRRAETPKKWSRIVRPIQLR